MTRPNEQVERNTTIVKMVLNGAKLTEVSTIWGINRQRVREILHRECLKLNPSIYYCLIGFCNNTPKIEALRGHKDSFIG